MAYIRSKEEKKRSIFSNLASREKPQASAARALMYKAKVQTEENYTITELQMFQVR